MGGGGQAQLPDWRPDQVTRPTLIPFPSIPSTQTSSAQLCATTHLQLVGMLCAHTHTHTHSHEETYVHRFGCRSYSAPGKDRWEHGTKSTREFPLLSFCFSTCYLPHWRPLHARRMPCVSCVHFSSWTVCFSPSDANITHRLLWFRELRATMR